MASFVKAFNMFPESRYLRVQRSHELDHKLGGVVSLLIIGTLLIVLVYKLLECFKKQTIVFSSQTRVDIDLPKINLNTYSSASDMTTFLIAFEVVKNDCITEPVIDLFGTNATYFNSKTQF